LYASIRQSACFSPNTATVVINNRFQKQLASSILYNFNLKAEINTLLCLLSHRKKESLQKNAAAEGITKQQKQKMEKKFTISPSGNGYFIDNNKSFLNTTAD
jgi:hypothetical protein